MEEEEGQYKRQQKAQGTFHGESRTPVRLDRRIVKQLVRQRQGCGEDQQQRRQCHAQKASAVRRAGRWDPSLSHAVYDNSAVPKEQDRPNSDDAMRPLWRDVARVSGVS